MTNFEHSLPFAALSVEQAGQLIRDIVLEGLKDAKSSPQPTTSSDVVYLPDALSVLKENGYDLKRGSLYNLIATDSIPYRKIGRRVVFSRQELIEWITEVKTKRASSKSDAALVLAADARRKLSIHGVANKSKRKAL